MVRKLTLFFLTLSSLLLFPLVAQNKLEDTEAISNALTNKQYGKADSLLQLNIRRFTASNDFDTLPFYISFIGELTYKQKGAKEAIAAVYTFVDFIHAKDSSLKLLISAYNQSAEFFGSIGQNTEGYEACKKRTEIAKQLPGDNRKELAICEYNMGVYAQRLADIALSIRHHRKALELNEEVGADPEDIYMSYNAMAACMWYSSKYDSATFFYTKALSIVEKLPATPINRYYRPAIIENNIAGLYSVEGKTSDAIAAMQRAIQNYQQFIAVKEPHPKKNQAISGLYQSIDNLAGIYKEIGDFDKAGDLLLYSYQQKKKQLNPDEPDIFISEILIGQHYNATHQYEKALQYLTLGLQKLDQSSGDYLYWQANANYGLALVYTNKRNTVLARSNYQKAEALFEASYGEEYDNARMDFARNAALFYASHENSAEAVALANKVLTYLKSVKQGESLQAFYQLLNIAEIQLKAGDFTETTRYSRKALDLLHQKIGEGRTILDSVKMQVFQPKAILLNVKAMYYSSLKKDRLFLQDLSLQLKGALRLLEKRKVLLDDSESIGVLIADNSELIDFAKKIEFELYELTDNPANLDEFINLHESGIYNRIRSRLDKENAVQFAHLPKSIQSEERQLKAAITESFKGEEPDSRLMSDYLLAIDKWEKHLEKVKHQYPDYYEMRYATIFKPLPKLQAAIPIHSTLIRFYFTDGQLLALVADSSSRNLIKLDTTNIVQEITELAQPSDNEELQGALLHHLYRKLWQPLASHIKTKKIILIPDGILYNLSFDLLSPVLLTKFSQVVENSLLSKHSITYHYSLFMLNQSDSHDQQMENYVAFAPGFSDEAKNDYTSAVKDSFQLDYHYLSLLPQPNTRRLTQKMENLLGGKAYIERASTPASFRENAAGHKIIHIGTHAEYNNVNPERTRLIFAKTANGPDENNSLFLADIYQCDIRSELTILTACESGKPGYQDGEGMVSLAHAFNYAGSKSILTSLWNLDEKATNIIVEKFVHNLAAKMPADEALQQAKISYLLETEGRMLAPAYWAGLVLMGKPAVIELEKPVNYMPYLAAVVAVLVLLVLIRQTRLI